MNFKKLLLILFMAFLPSLGASSPETRIDCGHVLTPSDYILSASGRFSLKFCLDGSLTLFDKMIMDENDPSIIWNNDVPFSNPDRCQLQYDGNLVVYNSDLQSRWSSRTSGNEQAFLQVQDDGNVVIYNKDSQPIFQTFTQGANRFIYLNACLLSGCGHSHPETRKEGGFVLMPGESASSSLGVFELNFGKDGELKLLDKRMEDENSSIMWRNNTCIDSPGRCQLQEDGNFVTYDSQNVSKWDSHTSKFEGAFLQIQNDGNLVIYAKDSQPVFQTHTDFNSRESSKHPKPRQKKWGTAGKVLKCFDPLNKNSLACQLGRGIDPMNRKNPIHKVWDNLDNTEKGVTVIVGCVGCIALGSASLPYASNALEAILAANELNVNVNVIVGGVAIGQNIYSNEETEKCEPLPKPKNPARKKNVASNRITSQEDQESEEVDPNTDVTDSEIFDTVNYINEISEEFEAQEEQNLTATDLVVTTNHESLTNLNDHQENIEFTPADGADSFIEETASNEIFQKNAVDSKFTQQENEDTNSDFPCPPDFQQEKFEFDIPMEHENSLDPVFVDSPSTLDFQQNENDNSTIEVSTSLDPLDIEEIDHEIAVTVSNVRGYLDLGRTLLSPRSHARSFGMALEEGIEPAEDLLDCLVPSTNAFKMTTVGHKAIRNVAMKNGKDYAKKKLEENNSLDFNSNSLPRYQGPKPDYHVNPAHVKGPRFNPKKTPLPDDASDVFKRAIPSEANNPRAWYGKNKDGVIYRFSDANDGTAHFSGMNNAGDGLKNIPAYAKDRLKDL